MNAGLTATTRFPALRSLESEDGQERAPPRIGDALGEVVVLDHVGDPQVFVIDHVVRLHQREGFLVVEVAALAGDVLMRLGQQRDGLAPPVAALLASGDPPLAAAQIGFGLAIVRGVKIGCPSASVAKDSSPRSIPVSWPVDGSGCTGTSAQEMATYHPSASFEMVTVLGVPSMGRDQCTLMRPILERTSKPLSSRAPLPYSLKVKEWKRFRPLKRGKPAFSPRWTRRKNA